MVSSTSKPNTSISTAAPSGASSGPRQLESASKSVLIGVSPWVAQVQSEIDMVAPYSSSVLVAGPSGTGKELVARSVHERGPRADHPFIPVNCAAISGTLFESHMFGHLKGAFTGSNYEAMGCFRAANGGTIFLDEVGELEADMQAKLLRVLQEQAVVPVGSHQEQPIDARIVAATNRNLLEEVGAGRFREDLYYRIAVISIRTVPLQQRPEDIELLADYVVSRLSIQHGLPFKPLSQSALDKLRRHRWPGNVRELQNVLERGCMRSQGDLIEAADLDFDSASTSAEPAAESPVLEPADAFDLQPRSFFANRASDRWPTMQECEREIITETLIHTSYNQTAAARLLDMDRSVLRRRIEKLGIDISRSTPGRPSAAV